MKKTGDKGGNGGKFFDIYQVYLFVDVLSPEENYS
jgi:hypothetical protein